MDDRIRSAMREAYYLVKPLLPRGHRLLLRRTAAELRRRRHRSWWPIHPLTGMPPPGWRGWPHRKPFALVLTHDVDSRRGQARVPALMDLERELGFTSAFFFVAAEARDSGPLRSLLAAGGFEVGLHGLFHDHRMFVSRAAFERRAPVVNRFLDAWGVRGFRSPVMYHRLDWLHGLNVGYDASTFDADPFEPQPEGVGTIFPFVVRDPATGRSFVELPYTLAQDFTLFVLLRERTIDLWKRKLDWIARRGGMALVITHPDYMALGARRAVDEYPVRLYRDFLIHVRDCYGDAIWRARPGDVADWISSGAAP